jgi:hypothetical protein
MSEDVRQALAIDASSTIEDRTIDITTTGRRSGEPQDNTSLRCHSAGPAAVGARGTLRIAGHTLMPALAHMHDWADGRVGGTQATQICDHHRRHRHAQATAQLGG